MLTKKVALTLPGGTAGTIVFPAVYDDYPAAVLAEAPRVLIMQRQDGTWALMHYHLPPDTTRYANYRFSKMRYPKELVYPAESVAVNAARLLLGRALREQDAIKALTLDDVLPGLREDMLLCTFNNCKGPAHLVNFGTDHIYLVPRNPGEAHLRALIARLPKHYADMILGHCTTKSSLERQDAVVWSRKEIIVENPANLIRATTMRDYLSRVLISARGGQDVDQRHISYSMTTGDYENTIELWYQPVTAYHVFFTPKTMTTFVTGALAIPGVASSHWLSSPCGLLVWVPRDLSYKLAATPR